MMALRILVGALLVSTAVHYTDNWLSIEDYAPRSGFLPENPWAVPVAWLIFAAIGLAGYREYARRGTTTRAHALLATFSLAGLTTPLHLLYEGNSFAAWQWVSVASDGLTGAAVLAFALWSVAGVRPPAASGASRA
jgi:tryptophan-rich sensory protein